jgi:hypothetical protein
VRAIAHLPGRKRMIGDLLQRGEPDAIKRLDELY